MTEREWLECGDPARMLEYLATEASERKLRLFAVACCGRIWRLLPEGASREAVETAERYADGLATDSERDKAAEQAWQVIHDLEASWGEWTRQGPGYLTWLNEQPTVSAATAAAYAVESADESLSRSSVVVLDSVAPPCFRGFSVEGDHTIGKSRSQEQQAQCVLLRCLFGNPFRYRPADPAWLTWNDGTVLKLARAIDEEKAFDRLPVLADALEEAGCTDSEMLAHCREPREHARGCWVIDLLLAKE